MGTRFYLMIASLAISTLAESRSNCSPSIDTLFDVFPLSPSLSYVYQFEFYSYGTDEFFSSSISDTGRMQYRIVDSTTLNDSIVTWRILECRDFKATERATESPDTTYYVSDTASLVLYEKKTGLHELVCSGIIWKFPLMHLNGLISVPLFRYMDSPYVRLNWEWHNPPGYSMFGVGTDSLVLSNRSGLSKRNLSQSWVNGYFLGNNNLSVRAERDPEAVPNRPYPFPAHAHLSQNFPNPFNLTTTILFRLEGSGFVSLKIFDVLGRFVESVHEGFLRSGEHIKTWQALDRPSGVYFCRLQSANRSETIRLLLLK